MPRFAAFLRGVSPMNCKMPALAAALEAAGFTEVRTLLSSGNAVFTARGAEAGVRRRAEAALQEHLGTSFLTLVRRIDELQALLDEDPYRAFELAPGAKKVVTFLPAPPASVPRLPMERDGARILALRGRELLTAYVPDPRRGGAFMAAIEKAFGKDITTRTWETVKKVAAAG